MALPTVEAALALDGKIFAMLTPEEKRLLHFYRAHGRKYGVSASIINKADPDDLARARTEAQAEEIMRRANSIVSVVRS
ncbi:hypothetical protein IQ22_04137 [Pseudomonas duriflava]|uniref:Uncharacterized protein n=1 Tax=Pseudomonas duriflava TaxID=459528 RepID=A0A562PX86_9PSED|nr:hypothetical protein [Pseudomonas duriflava]TWI49003.1 hypothetical protein IQ22_04137 [Pseudomonas duriflava]